MSDSKKNRSEHDIQTSATAESIRELVKRHNLRSGANQADIERFNEELEQIACQLDEQGKSEKEVEKMREERGAESPKEEQKTPAELMLETIEESKKADEQRKKEGQAVPAGGKPETDPNANRLGMPAIPAQPTTAKRDAVENTAKKADDAIRKTTETASKK